MSVFFLQLICIDPGKRRSSDNPIRAVGTADLIHPLSETLDRRGLLQPALLAGSSGEKRGYRLGARVDLKAALALQQPCASGPRATDV